MTMFKKIVKEFKWGQHNVRLETGEIARQASGAVIVDVEDTVVLATVVGAKTAKPGQDFFPLTVDYLEKTYAAGKIPGGFFRREGRPSEGETLISRLIDRPLRPLFPEGFYNEVQVVIHVLSLNPEVPADIPALIGASAALAISGLPFNGPVGAARVAYINNEYVLNPTRPQMKESALDLIVAGTEARRADGGIGSAATDRRSHARRRGVRPRPNAGRDRRDPRTGSRRRQAGMGLEAGRRRTSR